MCRSRRQGQAVSAVRRWAPKLADACPGEWVYVVGHPRHGRGATVACQIERAGPRWITVAITPRQSDRFSRLNGAHDGRQTGAGIWIRTRASVMDRAERGALLAAIEKAGWRPTVHGPGADTAELRSLADFLGVRPTRDAWDPDPPDDSDNDEGEAS